MGLCHPSPGSLWHCRAQCYRGGNKKSSSHVTGLELEGTQGCLDLALPSIRVTVLMMTTLTGIRPAPYVSVFCDMSQQPI